MSFSCSSFPGLVVSVAFVAGLAPGLNVPKPRNWGNLPPPSDMSRPSMARAKLCSFTALPSTRFLFQANRGKTNRNV